MYQDKIHEKLGILARKLVDTPLSDAECIWLIETCEALVRNGLSLTRVTINQSEQFQELVKKSCSKFPEE